MIKELKKGIWWNGIYDRALEVFDIIMTTEFGTTYNAYTIKGSEKTALIETAKSQFEEAYFSNVAQITPLDKIDYIVVNHTEPDHSGSIEKLLALSPGAEVVGSMAAIGFLKEITNLDFKCRVVKDGEEISLGDKTLRFISVPNLHWPDSMYTYIPQDQVIFTCDSFGAHYGAGPILRSELADEEGYLRAAKYYFEVIMSPFKPFVRKAMEKIKDLPIDMICTGHGPVLDSHIPELMACYKDWSSDKNPNQGKTVVIAYVSAYGYTRAMAKAIQEGIEAEGVAVHAYDLVEETAGIDENLLYADGLLLGSPTILGDALKPIYDLSSTMLPTTHSGKQAAAFGSYGWTGEAVANLTQRLGQLKMKVSDGIRVRFNPSAAELEACRVFGKEFAEKVNAAGRNRV